MPVIDENQKLDIQEVLFPEFIVEDIDASFPTTSQIPHMIAIHETNVNTMEWYITRLPKNS